MSTCIGVENGKLNKTCKIFFQYLANHMVLTKIKKCHWNMPCPNFSELHKLFDTYVGCLNITWNRNICKYLSQLICAFISLAVVSLLTGGCASTPAENSQLRQEVNRYFRLDKPEPVPYKISRFGLTMQIPPGFQIITEPLPEEEDPHPQGLLWAIQWPTANEKENHGVTIEFFYDFYDQKYLSLKDPESDPIIQELSDAGYDLNIKKSTAIVSGRSAQAIDLVDQFQDSNGSYDMHFKIIFLKKSRHTYLWRFYCNQLDYLEFEKTINDFLNSIEFD